MRHLCSVKTKVAMYVVCLALPFLGLQGRAAAATITNILSSPGWQMQVLNINAGDTVVWVNQQTSPPTNVVESYGGEWGSPQLNPGDSFSFTFTNAGSYAYRTGMPRQTYNRVGALPGTIAVSGWTSAPPAVTINTPVEGFALPQSFEPLMVLVQASVTNNERIASIEYFANTNSIGKAYSPPFGVLWEMSGLSGSATPAPGPYALLAKAVDRDGSVTLSQPVTVLVGPFDYSWGARVLPGGHMMFYYTADMDWPGTAAAFVVSSDSLAWRNSYVLTEIDVGSGVFVDEGLPPTAGQSRFYFVVWQGIK
jgi:plastocyanin